MATLIEVSSGLALMPLRLLERYLASGGCRLLLLFRNDASWLENDAVSARAAHHTAYTPDDFDLLKFPQIVHNNQL